MVVYLFLRQLSGCLVVLEVIKWLLLVLEVIKWLFSCP